MKALFKVTIGLIATLAVVAAIAIAVLWRGDIPYETLEQRFAVPTSHYVNLPSGVRAHYRDDGPANAPVVVLVHGFGDSFLSWAGWIDVLSKDFRVITVDVPGHGLTRAPADFVGTPDNQAAFIDDFAAAAHLPPFAIVGNSMGGGIAWRTTLSYPDRIRALILLDAAGFPNEVQKSSSPIQKFLGSPVGRFLQEHLDTRPLTTWMLKRAVVDDAIITPELVNGWAEVQRAPGHRHILMNGTVAQTDAAALAAIHVPTLVQWGEEDPAVLVANAHSFASAIPGAVLITYPNVGHLPQLEIPERSAGDAAAFLRHALATPAQSG